MQPELLVLLRHGQCEDNQDKRLPSPNSPLTDLGKVEATQAVHLLQPYVISPIYVTSPLPRARSTAEIIASRLPGPLEEDQNLVEMDFGVATGCTEPEFKMRFPLHKQSIAPPDNLDFSWPQGESRRKLLQRVTQALNMWLSRSGFREIVFVSHWVTLGFLHAYIVHGNISNWQTFSPPHAIPVAFEVLSRGKTSLKHRFRRLGWSWKPQRLG